MTTKQNTGSGNKMSVNRGDDRFKGFLLVVRRALIMIVRGIEDLYPDDFKK